MHTFGECQTLSMTDLRDEINERLQILELGCEITSDLFTETRDLIDLYSGHVLNQLQRTCTKISKPIQVTHICGDDCRIHKQ